MKNRLGRDHFQRTNDLRIDSHKKGGDWHVYEEYEVQEVPDQEMNFKTPEGWVYAGESKIVSKDPLNMSRCTTYHPMSDPPHLFLVFARLFQGDLTPQSILDWVQRYGFLGIGKRVTWGFGREEF